MRKSRPSVPALAGLSIVRCTLVHTDTSPLSTWEISEIATRWTGSGSRTAKLRDRRGDSRSGQADNPVLTNSDADRRHHNTTGQADENASPPATPADDTAEHPYGIHTLFSTGHKPTSAPISPNCLVAPVRQLFLRASSRRGCAKGSHKHNWTAKCSVNALHYTCATRQIPAPENVPGPLPCSIRYRVTLASIAPAKPSLKPLNPPNGSASVKAALALTSHKERPPTRFPELIDYLALVGDQSHIGGSPQAQAKVSEASLSPLSLAYHIWFGLAKSAVLAHGYVLPFLLCQLVAFSLAQ
ncbi:uncharacterized protein CTHT_0041400 [Thermochaetoides thermophila DSM 1495]|uniref:Uncharacterized protein n=1 Tax=Chaetomium thermophilum (strain DSM 1495 / CBS 144.50 / IMI 039719) TaxID=759272 RepID=G0SA89_CHATD|nr:hypothetical protein CTHT_0041400 [Thermochaetoides thermophila DSM 1495]EGS19661.1 hypothetical protein CTHT_0041400 [Thermochaetoides thermophila DSM 1495]